MRSTRSSPLFLSSSYLTFDPSGISITALIPYGRSLPGLISCQACVMVSLAVAHRMYQTPCARSCPGCAASEKSRHSRLKSDSPGFNSPDDLTVVVSSPAEIGKDPAFCQRKEPSHGRSQTSKRILDDAT